MRTTLLIALLAGCGGNAVVPAPISNAAATETPPAEPPYAKLFVEGTLTFPAVATDYGGGDAEPTVARGEVTCTISDLATTGDMKKVTLRCDHDTEIEIYDLPHGHLGWRADGLWELDDLDRKPVTHLMPANPVAGEVKQPARAAAIVDDVDGYEDVVEESVTLASVDGLWCITSWASLRRESSSWTLCLKDGAIVGGRGDHSGFGESQKIEFGAAPDLP